MIKINKKNFNILIWTLILKLIIDLLYVWFIAPVYSYRQLFLDFSMCKYTLSWIFTILIFIVLPKNENKVSYLVLQFHYYIMVIPFLSIWGLKNESSKFTMMFVLCFCIEIVALRSDFIFRIPHINNSRTLLWSLLIFLTIYTYSFLLMYNRPSLLAFDFSKVYGIRAGVKYATTFLRYSTVWQFRCINPYFIVYGIKYKNNRLVGLFSFLQLIMYLIIAKKEILFSIIFIIFLAYMLENIKFMKCIVLGLCGACTFSGCVYIFFYNIIPLALFPTRVLFDPAVIKFQFYDVFTTKLPKLFYSESLIGRIFGIEYLYDRASGYIVNSFFSSVDSMANTGYLAYAYANMGFVGMLIISIFFVLLMKIIDSSVANVKLAFAFLAYPIMGLNDGDILVCLLTGGLFLLMVILIIDEDLFGNHDKVKI